MKSLKKLSHLKILLFIVLLTSSLTGFSQQSLDLIPEKSVVKTIYDKDIQWGPCPSFMPDGCNIAVLHGDPSKQNVDVLFKVKANSDIPNHWHNSPERMILLSGELEVTYENETTQIMKVGSYGYGPSKKPHTAKCISKDPCIIFIAFENPVDAFAISY